MRRALVVVVLIGLSFGAGVAFNGSGLAWARALLHGRHESTIEEIDAPTVTESSESDPFPAAPMPALGAGGPPTGVAAPAPKPPTPSGSMTAETALEDATPAAAEKETDLKVDELAPPDIASATPPDTGGGKPEPLALPAQKPADVPAPPVPASSETEAMASEENGGPPPRQATAKGPETGWSDVPGSAPAAAVVPGRVISGSHVDAAVAPAGLNGTAQGGQSRGDAVVSDWAVVRQRLRAQGISRYWIEGEPAGPVRFRCVIPLAGQRAVSQQFEGEGDDEVRAAEAALRRVALWKATESR